jgi:hypothetical protein
MISSNDFRIFVLQFKTYIESLGIPDSYMQEHIDLKVKHTYDVIGNIRYIAKNTGLPESDTILAKTIALVHDIGRFQQFLTYATFDDRLSVNHAELGIKVLQDLDFFHAIKGNVNHSIIIQSVLNHNIPHLNDTPDERVLMFSQLLRDADKVDIWKLMTIRDVVFKILDQEHPDKYTVPNEILHCFLNGQVVPAHYAETLNDYRLLRLSWIYDMHFPATFGLLFKNNYAAKILSKIPQSERLDEISGIVHGYIHQIVKI